MLFFNISEPDASNLEADHNYVSKLCKDTFDLDVKILKAWQESAKQMQAIVSVLKRKMPKPKFLVVFVSEN